MPMSSHQHQHQQHQHQHQQQSGGGSGRKIGIAVDLSDESAFAVKWAVLNYLRPSDNVILVHVRPTSVLYGADWGSIDLAVAEDDDEDAEAERGGGGGGGGGDGGDVNTPRRKQKLEDDFDAFTATKAGDLAQPLLEAKLPFRIHIVKDHDMKERLCLEVERLGLSALIMGSRGFGASAAAARRAASASVSGASPRASAGGRLGSVSDYCVHHCVCPVVVVRYPDDAPAGAPQPQPQPQHQHQVVEEGGDCDRDQ